MPSDTFAKIGDIKGESQDVKHKDEIEVLSFSWGVANSSSMSHGSGGGSGKATFDELTFTHHVDKASAPLWQACATGAHIKEATFTRRKAGKGQQEFILVKMDDVMVTRVIYNESNGDGGGPSESVTLAFAKVAFEYKPQKADGSLDAGINFKYDIKAQKEQ